MAKKIMVYPPDGSNMQLLRIDINKKRMMLHIYSKMCMNSRKYLSTVITIRPKHVCKDQYLKIIGDVSHFYSF